MYLFYAINQTKHNIINLIKKLKIKKVINKLK